MSIFVAYHTKDIVQLRSVAELLFVQSCCVLIQGRAETFAFAFFSFPKLGSLTVFTLTDGTVP